MMEELAETSLINVADDTDDSVRCQLEEALRSNYIFLFRQIINSEDVSICWSALESHDTASQMSVFEIACEMACRADFVRDIISVGCDANTQNLKCGRRPINFAIEHFDYENLEALLSDTSVCTEFPHSFDFPYTPINYLLYRMTDKEFHDIYLCFELLLKHCADVNAPGKDGKTPIQTIMAKENLNEGQKMALVKCIFDHAKYIDIDDDNGSLRSQLDALKVDGLTLPPFQRDQRLSDMNDHHDYMEGCLQDGNEFEFWRQYSRIDKYQLLESSLHYFLLIAVHRCLLYSVEKMFRLGLMNIMHSLDGCEEPLLITAIRLIKWSDNDGEHNNKKCFNLFLDHRRIDVNAKDKFGYTAVMCSIQNKLSNVTAKLLDRGAYIGMTNKWGAIKISDIKPQLLEKHFDSCITINEASAHADNLELTFDYKNLIPVQSKERKETSPKMSVKFCEMEAIECILETCALRHLLKHPLIESFLDLKWKRLALIFYTNFFFCALFAVFNILYIKLYYLDGLDSTILVTVCQMLFLCLVTREMFQMISSPCFYFKRFQNYVECALIGLNTFILLGSCPIAWRSTLTAVTILLIGYEFTSLIGTLPIRSVAMHYVMLEKVATNFFKSLLLYSTIIASFALAFSSLFHRQQNDEQQMEEYNNFRSVGLSLLKSIVMAIGELEASSIKFNDNALSYFIFVAFVLLVTTVLANLLNGLAVSDINEIKSQAEWTHLIRRCQILALYERIFRDKLSWLSWFPMLEQLIRSKICLYPGLRLKYQMKFNPNTRHSRNIRKRLGNWFQHIKRMFCLEPPQHIDKQISKEALQRVNVEITDVNEIVMLRDQISKIAESNNLLVHRNESLEEEVRSIRTEIEKLLLEL